MSKPLPELLDPRRAVAAGEVYRGDLPLAGLDRLADLVDGDQGGAQVAYSVSCSRDESGHEVIAGTVRAQLRLRCQRCNKPYDLPVDASFRLALVDGIDEADALPDEYEPLLLEDRLIRPRELIEDELILAVPAVPRHPQGQCRAPPMADEAAAEPTEQHDDGPFAALAGLRTKRDDDARD